MVLLSPGSVWIGDPEKGPPDLILSLDRKRPTHMLASAALPESREQVVVGFMGTDPEPMKNVTFTVSNDTVRAANVRCPNCTFLFERQRWVKRILFE